MIEQESLDTLFLSIQGRGSSAARSSVSGGR